MTTRLRVLIADDDEANRRLSQDLLDMEGFDTLTAADGEQAVALAREHIPAVILMDWRMPVMGGRDAVRILRADPLTASIPVLAVTASAMPDDIREIRSAGCTDFILKPIEVHDFIAKVKLLAYGEGAHG